MQGFLCKKRISDIEMPFKTATLTARLKASKCMSMPRLTSDGSRGVPSDSEVLNRKISRQGSQSLSEKRNSKKKNAQLQNNARFFLMRLRLRTHRSNTKRHTIVTCSFESKTHKTH